MIKFTIGIVIVTEALKDGRVEISLSILEHGGRPVIAGRSLWWIASSRGCIRS